MDSASKQSELLAGKYRLLSRIGRGGMGEVWLAEEEGPAGFRRMVAVKKLLSTGEISDVIKDSFVAEAHVIARLDHPNIVRLIELGATDAGLYLVLDFVDGCSLDRLVKNTGALSPVCTAYVGREVARALHAVHTLTDDDGVNCGVVHRDVSPANILVGLDGRVRLTDFGIARISGFIGDKTETGVLKGKLPYMPPEVASGQKFDGRADVFSLGVTLLETLLGGRLRRAETQSQFIAMVATEPVPRVSELAPETPKPLARALDLATEFEFEDRCPSSAELEALLEDALWEQGARAEKQAIEELRERVGTATGGSLSRSAKNMAMQDSGARTPWSVRLDPSSPGSASGIRAAPGTPTSFGEPTSGFTPPPSVTLGSAGPSTAPPVDGAPTSVTNVASTAEARVATAAPRGSLRMVGMIVALILGALAAVVFVRWPGDAPDGAPRDRATGTGVGSADDLAASDTSAASTAAPPATQVVTDAGPTASGSAPPSSSTAPSPVGVHGSPPVRPPPAAASADEESTEPGTLQVVAIPWANVSVDGRPLGVTPVAPVSLPPGTHTVVLVNSELGATRTMSVTIKPGKPSLLRVDLKRTSP